MIDIHCHILSGMDDGAGSIADSIEMAELAVSSGVTEIIATPHSNIPRMPQNRYDDRFKSILYSFTEELQRRNIPLTIYPGQEIFLVSETVPALLNLGELIGLNHSRYVLVEFDMHETFENAFYLLRSLRSSGYVPVVAHPERYSFVLRNIDTATRIKHSGCLLQVNRGSILGRFGENVRRVSYVMLQKNLADFVASDAHSPYSRTTYLSDVDEYISEKYGAEYAKRLLTLNPRAVINNEDIPFYSNY